MELAWLLEYREDAQMSQNDVAAEVGITRQYYGMIESGVRKPSVEVAKKIASLLGFAWTVFFEEKSNEKLPNSQKPA